MEAVLSGTSPFLILPDDIIHKILYNALPDITLNTVNISLNVLTVNRAIRKIVVESAPLTRQMLATRGRRLETATDAAHALRISPAWHWPILGTVVLDWVPSFVMKSATRDSTGVITRGRYGLKVGHITLRGNDPVFNNPTFVKRYILQSMKPLGNTVTSVEISDCKEKDLNWLPTVFPKLTRLVVTKCPKLTTLPPVQTVTYLTIDKCPNIALQTLPAVLPQLAVFMLRNFSKAQLHSGTIAWFLDHLKCLDTMFVGASNMNAFPMHAGPSAALRSLVLFDMPKLTRSPQLCYFPSVTYFQLRNCPHVSTVYSGPSSALTTLVVSNCVRFSSLHSLLPKSDTLKVHVKSPHSILDEHKAKVNAKFGATAVQ